MLSYLKYMLSVPTKFIMTWAIAPALYFTILPLTFANESEIMALINTKNFNEVITFAKEIKKQIIITRGEKGAISIIGDKITEIKANKNLTIKDLTGAGDLFAAGYLHGFINNLPTEECLEQATKLSSKVIQQIGARL